MRAHRFSLLAIPALLLASGCTSEEKQACSSVSFPAAPSDAGETLFVASSCSAENPDGSREKPFSSISEAIAKAHDGATLLIAEESSYDEDIVIDKPLRLLGAPPKTAAKDASVVLRPKNGGIRVLPGVTGVVLRGFDVERAKGFGVWVTKGASATLDGILVHKTEPDGDGSYGYGILVQDGAKAEITRVTVTEARAVGIYVLGATASMDKVEVESVLGHGGIRVEDAPELVVIHDTLVSKCSEVGILVSNSKATLQGATVLGTTSGTSSIGDAIVVRRRKNADGQYAAAARADISTAVIAQTAGTGIVFSEGAEGSIKSSHISSCGTSSTWAAGIWLQSGAGGEAGIEITENTLSENTFLGIGVTTGASAVIENNTSIDNTIADLLFVNGQYLSVGDGIGVFDGAHATITQNSITASQRFGVIMDNPGSATTLTDNTIHDNGQFGLVVQHAKGDIPTFTKNDFQGNGFGSTSILGQNEPPFPIHSTDLATP